MGTYIPPVAMAPMPDVSPTGTRPGFNWSGKLGQGIGGAAGVGAGLLAGFLGSKTGAGKRLEESYGAQGRFRAGAEKAMGGALDLGNLYTGMGGEAGKKGISGLTSAQDYYGKLLSGDPQAIAEITGTSASDLSKQLGQSAQYAQRTGRRSGATAATVANIPSQLMQNAAQLRLQARQLGGQGMTDVGSILGQLGGQYGQVAGQGYGTAGDIGSNMFGKETEWQRYVGGPAAASGGGIFSKILGAAKPFISMIPGAGPIISGGMTAAGL